MIQRGETVILESSSSSLPLANSHCCQGQVAEAIKDFSASWKSIWISFMYCSAVPRWLSGTHDRTSQCSQPRRGTSGRDRQSRSVIPAAVHDQVGRPSSPHSFAVHVETSFGLWRRARWRVAGNGRFLSMSQTCNICFGDGRKPKTSSAESARAKRRRIGTIPVEPAPKRQDVTKRQ